MMFTRAWLEELPRRLGFPGVRVSIRSVVRGAVTATKVDFEIPSEGEEPAGHGARI